MAKKSWINAIIEYNKIISYFIVRETTRVG
jgi:hypothetical protein